MHPQMALLNYSKANLTVLVNCLSTNDYAATQLGLLLITE